MTWAVEKYVVILNMPKTFLQPVEVISEVLHAENQASIRAEPQRVVLHHIIHLDQLSDICYLSKVKWQNNCYLKLLLLLVYLKIFFFFLHIIQVKEMLVWVCIVSVFAANRKITGTLGKMFGNIIFGYNPD